MSSTWSAFPLFVFIQRGGLLWRVHCYSCLYGDSFTLSLSVCATPDPNPPRTSNTLKHGATVTAWDCLIRGVQLSGLVSPVHLTGSVQGLFAFIHIYRRYTVSRPSSTPHPPPPPPQSNIHYVKCLYVSLKLWIIFSQIDWMRGVQKLISAAACRISSVDICLWFFSESMKVLD